MERVEIISRHVHCAGGHESRHVVGLCAGLASKPMRKLFVANRGEIALRVMRAAADLNISAVGCMVHDDMDALHARSVAEVATVPSYLDVDAIVAAAVEKGCDALHPGYGYLSESAELASKCKDAGIEFVGPLPETLALFGDKTAARRFAKQHGVPVAAGGDRECASTSEVREAMKRDGVSFPIMLKAANGGGGRGMRQVFDDADLDAAFATCVREANAAFGKGGMFFEELLTKARHIEVQLLGDGTGNCVHLYERDCSVQRRGQKVIEMSPARGLGAEIQRTLRGYALDLGRACAYRGVGTFEFLLSGSKIAFIEANARVQVEHTVTEEACNVDLVRAQLLVAQGMSLEQIGLTQGAIKLAGYAIQARVVLTQVGVVGSYAEPGGKDIRVDSCCFPGMQASSQFDPMIAKVIARGPLTDLLAADGDGFDAVRRRLVRACSEFHVGGSVQTNLDELVDLLESREYKENQWTTNTLDASDKAASSERPAQANSQSSSRRRAKFLDDALGGGTLSSSGKHSKAPKALRDVPPGHVWIIAAVQGQVVSGAKETVEVGQHVSAGSPVLVLNAMKMECLVTSPYAGTVVEVVAPGRQVEVGEQVVLLRQTDSGSDRAAQVGSQEDSFEIRPSLQRLFERRRITSDEARTKNDAAFARRTQNRRARGHLTARENVANLTDEGTFIEYGQLCVAAQKRTRPFKELLIQTPADGIITGIGMVNSQHFPPDRCRCGIMVYDFTVLAGTQGLYGHEKVDRIVEVCSREALPIILFGEGGGGRPGDQDGHGVTGLTCSSFLHLAKLSGLVPLVGVAAGYCFAGNAAFLGVCDVVIATRGSNIGMGGPAMIEGGSLGKFAPTDIGPSEEAFAAGCIDILVEGEAEATQVAKKYLSYFQGALSRPSNGYPHADQRRLRNVVPENRLRVYNMYDAIELLVDTGSFLEMRGGFGTGIITGLARLEGRAIGLLANNPMHLGGAIDADAALKAARFLELYDAFDLPVVVLCDCPGFMVGPDHEREGAVRKVCRMFAVGSSITVPLVTVVLRKAYGLGAQAMAGGMMMGPNSLCVAWPTGEFGPMGLEGAVKLGFSKQLAAAAKEGPDAEKELFDTLVQESYRRGEAINAATGFEIDQVIDPLETRSVITQVLAAHPPSLERRKVKRRPCVSTF